jgi:steroid delta-isomerase-like uncharacterized protein
MDHKTVVRQFFDRINAGEAAAIVAMLAEDFVEHEEMPGLSPGREGVGELFTMFRAGFPNVRWEPEEMLVDGDKIVVRVRVTGTNHGEFLGMAPTGKIVDVQLIDILRIAVDGRIAEHWGVFDMFSLMHQLGVVGAPASPTTVEREVAHL